MKFNVESITEVMNKKGYALFEDDRKNYNINLIGIRTDNNIPNSFDDWFCVLWNFNQSWNFLKFKCTTDPGLFWLQNPMNPKGSAIVKEGQYRGLWRVGLHKGYKALQQKGNITVIRDFDRDSQFDFHSGREETGMYYINGHRAHKDHQSIQINKWSAGCQVIANPQDFKTLLRLCDNAKVNWGNSFTYTLLHERDF